MYYCHGWLEFNCLMTSSLVLVIDIIKDAFESYKFIIFQGVCEEMTYAEIKEKFPDDFAARDQNKFRYILRYLCFISGSKTHIGT